MTSKEMRDVVLITAPGVLAIAVFMLGQAYIPTRLLLPIVFGANFCCQIAVKLAVPDHIVLRLIPWPLFLTIVALMMAFIILFSDWSLIGWWTPLALVIIGLILFSIYVIVALADKKDDAAPPAD